METISTDNREKYFFDDTTDDREGSSGILGLDRPKVTDGESLKGY